MNTSTPALSRTWAITTTYRECGVVTEVIQQTVTLSRTVWGGKLSATLDGQACDVARADSLLRAADTRMLTAEVLVPSTIGKIRAHQLHRLMARAGVCSLEHYALATRAAGRDVLSLASLTEQEARRVWTYLRRAFPAVQNAA